MERDISGVGIIRLVLEIGRIILSLVGNLPHRSVLILKARI